MPGGSSLNDKELLLAAFKQAVIREKHGRAKYQTLADNITDKRLRRMFYDFVNTCEEHLSLLKKEMDNLNIK